jgi:hypothetical protein
LSSHGGAHALEVDIVIHEVDRQLRTWVGSVLTGSTVTLSAPDGGATGSGISLYLIQIANRPPARGGPKRPPLRLSLSYLVTTWADDPEDAHRMLGELAFAAMDHADYEVELTPVPLAVWSALGAAPRPSFVLRVEIARERPTIAPPIVRASPVLQSSAAVSIHGIVAGPGGVPIMGARVECPALGLATRTDAKGRFRFSAVPADPPPELRVVAKGQQRVVKADRRTANGDPLMIAFDELE